MQPTDSPRQAEDAVQLARDALLVLYGEQAAPHVDRLVRAVEQRAAAQHTTAAAAAGET